MKIQTRFNYDDTLIKKSISALGLLAPYLLVLIPLGIRSIPGLQSTI